MSSSGQDRLQYPLTPEEQAARLEAWEAECSKIGRIREDIERLGSDLSDFNKQLTLFEFVIQMHLGKAWVQANVEGKAGTPDGMSQYTIKSNKNYLRTGPQTDLLPRAEHYVRVRDLARRLFEFAPEKFYNTLVRNLSRRHLDGAAFEAEVVRMLVRLPTIIDLRKESMQKGNDYDIDLLLRASPRLVWAIEAKTKVEDGEYSDARLIKTLKQARGQLPPDGIGGIFVKAPLKWSENTDFSDRAPEVIKSFFRNTTRVHAIVLVWDVFTFDGPDSKSWNWSSDYAVFRSPSIDSTSDGFLGQIEKIWAQEHDLVAPRAPF
jgi:hypothetical protein